MNSQLHIESMRRVPDAIFAVTRGLSDEQFRFVPPSGNWSIVAIICHLADEEVEDFRARLRLTLESPRKAWPAIDPVQAATQRDYQNQDPRATLDRFMNERRASLAWLTGLSNPNWEQAYQHPKWGPIHAGDLLAAWAAHDLLHLRQITKRLFELNTISAGQFSTSYAGDWAES